MGIKKETVKTTVEIDSDIFYLAKLKALKQKKPLREVINESLAENLGVLKSGKKKKVEGTTFLLKLSKYRLVGGPADLARNHDRYTWK